VPRAAGQGARPAAAAPGAAPAERAAAAPVRDGALGGKVDAHAHARAAEGQQAVRAAQLTARGQAQHRARPARVQQAVLRAGPARSASDSHRRAHSARASASVSSPRLHSTQPDGGSSPELACAGVQAARLSLSACSA